MFSTEDLEIINDDTSIGSFLHIEWDYITNVFQITIGTNQYEKDVNSLRQKRTYKRTDCVRSSIGLNFGLKYRREISSIKVRLGKLYANLVRDKQAEQNAHARKNFTDTAVSAFPDLLDPLILGSSLNEKRDS
jgi:hypothetical protein